MTAVIDPAAAPSGAEAHYSALIDAVDAARTYGVPLAAVVAALQAEADARGWL